MKNNLHRLTDDWRMYFAGTYIFAIIDGRYATMYVDDVERTGDDRDLDGMTFHGTVTYSNGDQEASSWLANVRDEFRPISGYYQLGNHRDRRYWFQYTVPNRTQKKGLDTRNALVDHAPGISARYLAQVYQQSQDFLSRPGARDFYVRGNVVKWKGLEVGRMDGDVFVANENHKNKEALLCRLLQSI